MFSADCMILAKYLVVSLRDYREYGIINLAKIMPFEPIEASLNTSAFNQLIP